MLYEAIASHQRLDPGVMCVVYTGQIEPLVDGVTKDDIIGRAKERFGIVLEPRSLEFLPLKYCDMAAGDYWPRFTLLGQTLGTIWMAQDAISRLVPDVFIGAFSADRHNWPRVYTPDYQARLPGGPHRRIHPLPDREHRHALASREAARWTHQLARSCGQRLSVTH